VKSSGQKLDLSFTVNAVQDGVTRTVPFRDLLKRRTIVSVHMKNNTPSCDKQTAGLAEHAASFARAGYDVISLSRDTCGSHERYAKAKRIGHTLVSDPDDQFARAADSIVEKSMYGKKYLGPARAAFVLEKDGTVLAVAEKVDTADHAAQLQALIKSL
jgi:peroxiredoxin Q/BCP